MIQVVENSFKCAKCSWTAAHLSNEEARAAVRKHIDSHNEFQPSESQTQVETAAEKQAKLKPNGKGE